MDIVDIIGLIIAGLVIGALGRLAVPGKQSMPIWVHLIVGVAAVLVGYWIAALLGVEETDGIDWIRWIISIVVAAVAVYLVARFTTRRTIT
ncbi:MAG TPA: GlsB/YeaQ/YmgE family stress response membrane protein [Jiangellaceae bacterium]|nr:GlsB/YeaQ/YmgE family stress response membrane protein [Jiangellaceae bacterium]